MFSGADGLLMPMRPNIKDEARFPQKAAEYSASGTPIITNSVGQISKYFFSNINAIIAKDYTKEAYTDSMQWLLDNPIKAKEIGLRGCETGLKNLHYKNISKKYADFLKSI